MSLSKKLFTSLILSGAMLTGSVALAKQAATTAVETPVQQTVQQTAQAKSAVIVTDKVNINTADAAEIQKALIGIGAKKAEAIVQYREKHGAFTAAEQLLEVQGIGKATLEKNQDRIVF